MVAKSPTWLTTALVCAALSTCLRADAPAASTPPAGGAHPGITQSTDPGYVLQPNDYVQINVYQEDDLTTTTRVSPNGNIVLPLVGAVKVGGLTVADSCALIRKQLAHGFLRDPQVSITMVEFAARRFSVLGQVNKPGSYEMPQQEQVTLLDAIALAGGYTPNGNSTAVSVRRTTDGKQNLITIDARDMAQQPTKKAFFIQPGDVITVNEASKRLFSVLGQVQKPGSFEMAMETPVTILDAIAQAGGYTPTGNATAVSIRRTSGGTENIFTVNAREMAQQPSHKPFYIQPGDVITVTEAAKRYFSVLGQVQKPGSYDMPMETQVTILDAIAQASGYTNIANPSKVTVRRRSPDGKEAIFTINAKQAAQDSSHQPFYVQPGDIITVSESIF